MLRLRSGCGWYADDGAFQMARVRLWTSRVRLPLSSDPLRCDGPRTGTHLDAFACYILAIRPSLKAGSSSRRGYSERAGKAHQTMQPDYGCSCVLIYAGYLPSIKPGPFVGPLARVCRLYSSPHKWNRHTSRHTSRRFRLPAWPIFAGLQANLLNPDPANGPCAAFPAS